METDGFAPQVTQTSVGTDSTTMRTVEKHSNTPILDLLRPLPEPDTERVTGRFAAPFLAIVAAIAMTENLPTLYIPLGFLLANFITIAIHELGHLLAGWYVGMSFKYVRIDPFRVRLDSGRLRFNIRPRLFRGLALMLLNRPRRIRRRLITFVAGGPTASLLMGMILFVAGEITLARYDSPWPTFLDFLGAWSFIIGCLSLFPYHVGSYASDGMSLRALLFSEEEATQMIASHALSTLKSDALLPPDYARRWFRLAGASTRLQSNSYYANWIAYESEEDRERASLYLEGCLMNSARMDDDQRDHLIAEATVFTACRRDDAVKAEVWSKRIKLPNRLHPVWQARVRIALLCAHQQFENATAELDRALALIREAPDGAQRQRLEAAWVTWRQKIQQRLPVEVI